ncbi:helix-turn-helix transcriptional regulator [Amycolatopsis sp. NBC_00345]|uniref:helix-turn-helix transcriptional regulator n=1 Tax=Amycolatopsis sp. NBC_00345 TaxID=2975955 RepID=UPI002E269096
MSTDRSVLALPEFSPVTGTAERVPCERCRAGEAAEIDPRRQLSGLDAMILEAVATGVSSVRIASRLYISRQAVDYHIKGMQRQLNAVNRAELVSRAHVAGILDIGRWPPKVPPGFILEESRGLYRPVP